MGFDPTSGPGSGGGSSAEWLGPYSMTVATPDALDPPGYGAVFGETIGAGYLLELFAHGTAFDQLCNLSFGFGSDALAIYAPPNLAGDVPGGSNAKGVTSYNARTGGLPLETILTLAAGQIVGAIYSDDPMVPPTSGQAEIYARIVPVTAP